MNKIKLLLVAAVAAVSVVSATKSVSAVSECTIDPAPLNMWQKGFTENGDTITAAFTLKGAADCEKVMTLAVWKAPSANGQPINDQVLFDHETITFKRGANTITAKLPGNCYYQADLLKSASPTAPDGTANYAYQNGQIVDPANNPLQNFKFGGSEKCEDTPEEETPVEETPTETPTQTTTAAAVTTVPDAGPASIVAGTAGLSTSLGLAYNLIRRRKL